MAKLIERKHPTKPFVVRWYKPRQGQTSFATRAEAEAYLPRAEAYESDDGSGGSELFRIYATRWNEQTARTKTVRTVGLYERTLRLHVFPAIGDEPLSQITYEMCKNFLLSSGLTPSLAEKCKIIMSAIFREAIRDKRITENPVEGIVIGYNPRGADLVPVTYAQLVTITESIRPEWRLMVWLMYGAGLRTGEAMAVSLDGILEGGTVLRVHEQVLSQRHKADDTYLAPLKARKPGRKDSHRDIPLASWLLDMITKHCAEFGIESGYLFPSLTSGDTMGKNFRWGFITGRAKAGVPTLTPHKLRHYFASTMLANRVPISDVSRWLGHKNIQITFDTYSHLMPATVGVARDISDKAMREFKGEA